MPAPFGSVTTIGPRALVQAHAPCARTSTITALELEGFDAFAGRQRIELAPLTLLVGREPGGKGAILQALVYLRELVEQGNADLDHTTLGDRIVELGGFAGLVHRGDTTRAIVVRIEIATPGCLERFTHRGAHFPFPDLDDEIESAWLELTVRMRATSSGHRPIVDRAIIGVGSCSEPLVWLETGPTLHMGEPRFARVNLGHPRLFGTSAEVAEAWAAIAVPGPVGTLAQAARLDLDHRRLHPVFALACAHASALPHPDEPLQVIPGPHAHDHTHAMHAVEEVRTFLEIVVIGTIGQLSTALRDACCIGSPRAIPPREHLDHPAGTTSRWFDGLAAWDLLLTDRSSLVERTNDWLRRLGMRCEVVAKPLLAITPDPARPLAHDDATTCRLRLDTGRGLLMLPSEAGAGASQLVPVIVAALESRARLLLVELPELHLHPAVQLGLGDLFIDAAARDGGGRTVLVETQSEHLILRVLRRIREARQAARPDEVPSFTAEQLSVLHTEARPDGIHVRRLRADERGEFVDPWPHGFFAERSQELM